LSTKHRWSCPTSEPLPVFTIGHSTRTIPEFAQILQGGGVQLVIDVRSVPRSRTNPQYNFDALGKNLQPWQVSYRRIAELGGLRGRVRDVDPAVNAFWQNQSFHNYADYALGDAFPLGLDELLEISSEQRTAIMCSEAVWWRCHRRIIADYLLLKDRTACHLMGGGRITPATMTPGARERDGRLVYPAPIDATPTLQLVRPSKG
jgi:uncharacterized protein (DUF488 family)